MIETRASTDCEKFQDVAARWLRSGEITRTAHLLSPLEELAGFNYGFVYLLDVPGAIERVKIGFSEHPTRRLRELRLQHGAALRMRACFVGDPQAERFAHKRFAGLHIENELFLAHPIIDEYFRLSRERLRAELQGLHICSPACPQLQPRLDLRMLSAWLGRR